MSAGKHLAMAGSSQSVKVTVISLIERFYDDNNGIIMIDDLNVISN